MLARLLVLPPVLICALAGCGDDSGNSAAGPCQYPDDTGRPVAREVERPPGEPTESGQVPATIATSAGDVGVTLDAEAAPCTVNSFVSLAEQGYFDDTPCHRLTTAGIFVLQCGDPTGVGGGGPGYTIPDELTGDEQYDAGTLAMAKATSPDSGGSQFFLVYDDSQLPPDYTVFGEIDESGVDVLRQIAVNGTATGIPDGPPATEVRIASVTVE